MLLELFRVPWVVVVTWPHGHTESETPVSWGEGWKEKNLVTLLLKR